MVTSRLILAALLITAPVPALAQAEARPPAVPASPPADAPETLAPERAETTQTRPATERPDEAFDPEAGKPADSEADVAAAATETPAPPMTDAEAAPARTESAASLDAAIREMPVPEAEEIAAVLAPGGPADYRDTNYLGNIYRTPAMLRPHVTEEIGYDRHSPRIARTFVLNTNHSQVIALPFAAGEYFLDAEAMDRLDLLADALAADDLAGSRYLIGGHTDTTGEADFNHWLSEKRAHAVRAYLVMEHGIDPARLVAVGFGEDYPLDAADGADPKNRRIEVTLIEDPEIPHAVPLVDAPFAPGTDLDDFADLDLMEPDDGATVQPTMSMGFNPVCDTSDGYADSRPARHNLDDFGGYRTPVACDPHN